MNADDANQTGKVQICCLSSYRRSSVASQPQDGASLSKIEKDLTAAAGFIVRELRHVRARFESRQLKTEKLYNKGERGVAYATRR